MLRTRPSLWGFNDDILNFLQRNSWLKQTCNDMCREYIPLPLPPLPHSVKDLAKTAHSWLEPHLLGIRSVDQTILCTAWDGLSSATGSEVH